MKYITPYITPHTSQYLSLINTGLGNALFQIAACYGLSHKYNINVIFNNVHTYCNILYDRFNFNYKNTILRNIYNMYNFDIKCDHIVNETIGSTVDNAMIDTIIKDDLNYTINGYLECFDYFKDISSFIIDLFQPDIHSLEKIYANYSYIFNDSNLTPISIHFRGNEIMTMFNCDYDYYNRAIDYILSKVNNPHFLIFTDDISIVDLNRLNIKNYTFIKNDYDYLDLWTMSLCTHNILSISTFSWWGAFLNKNINKIVLYNNNFNHHKLDIYDIFTKI